MAAALFPSLLGVEFDALDPCLKAVHGGGSRRLVGIATVERGASLAARALAVLASLPQAVSNAPIEVWIEATSNEELWTRVFPLGQRMVSTLYQMGGYLVERLGPATLRFQILVTGGVMVWELKHISVCGIPLPLRWFRISAKIISRNGRYHFAVNSQVSGMGAIVRYEGLLDAAP